MIVINVGERRKKQETLIKDSHTLVVTIEDVEEEVNQLSIVNFVKRLNESERSKFEIRTIARQTWVKRHMDKLENILEKKEDVSMSEDVKKPIPEAPQEKAAPTPKAEKKPKKIKDTVKIVRVQKADQGLAWYAFQPTIKKWVKVYEQLNEGVDKSPFPESHDRGFKGYNFFREVPKKLQEAVNVKFKSYSS